MKALGFFFSFVFVLFLREGVLDQMVLFGYKTA